MNSIVKAKNDFTVNVISRCGGYKADFPVTHDRWLKLLEGATVTMGEIKMFADYCHCSQAELLMADKKLKSLASYKDFQDMLRRFYETENNHNEFIAWKTRKLKENINDEKET